MYWRSAIMPSGQFVVYCFDAPDPAVSMAEVVRELRERARGVGDLRLRVLNVPGDLDRPYWVGSGVGPEAVVVYPVLTWRECLDRIGELNDDQVDPSESAWRIHLFGPLTGAPRGCSAGEGRAIVAVLQISHAVADGRGTAAICRALFGVVPPQYGAGGDEPVSGWLPSARWGAAALGVARLPVSVASMVWLGLRSFAEYRTAVRRSHPEAPGVVGVPATELNRSAGPGRTLRVIVLDRRSLPPGHSVTVAALTAISFALDELLGPVPRRTAELTVGRPPRPGVRNNFGNVAVDLHQETDDVGVRMSRIAEEVTAAQRKAATPDPVAESAYRAESATPAFLAHWAIRQFDIGTRPDTVTGVTVVSTVNRGPADLALAGGRVRFTTGFPALSPCQGLTHGVHGIGSAVAISVTTSPEIVDVDAYVEMLRRALDRVSAVGPSRL